MTNRAHGGAPLHYVPLNTPGFMGLNKQAEGTILGPEWATRLENTVIDTNNRIASRKGWLLKTTGSTVTGNIEQMHWELATDHMFTSSSDPGTLSRSTDKGINFTDVTSGTTVTDANGTFHDFNGSIYYLQDGQPPSKYSTGSPTFEPITDVNAPQTSIGLSSFGRMWIVTASGKSIQYSALLDGDTWTGSDTGLINLNSVWQGDDQIVALANFNGALVVFGTNSIVFYTDGAGSALGIDPLNIYVADILPGQGCLARDSVVPVDGDLWFLSDTGLSSLGRLIQERSNPMVNLSQTVQDFLTGYLLATNPDNVQAVYSPKDRFYLLALSSGDAKDTNAGVTFCFDTRVPLQDGSMRCAGIWQSIVPRGMVVSMDGMSDVYMSRGTESGKVGDYAGGTDADSSYTLQYESGWTDMGSPNIKLLKRISAILFVAGAQDVVFKWAFEFGTLFSSTIKSFGAGVGGDINSEYGTGEWGISEYNAGTVIEEKHVSTSKGGEFVKIGISVPCDNTSIAIQQLSTYSRVGRLR